MPNIKYIARVLTGVRWKKMNYILGVVKDKCGQSKVRTFFDILWCAARYGAGYYDYAMYGFYDLTGKQRDTYLTRVRNRKISDLMNDPAFHDDFDDKLRFNETFRRFLRRETLNGETATPQQMEANGNLATKMMRTYTTQLEALARLMSYRAPSGLAAPVVSK